MVTAARFGKGMTFDSTCRSASPENLAREASGAGGLKEFLRKAYDIARSAHGRRGVAVGSGRTARVLAISEEWSSDWPRHPCSRSSRTCRPRARSFPASQERLARARCRVAQRGPHGRF